MTAAAQGGAIATNYQRLLGVEGANSWADPAFGVDDAARYDRIAVSL